MTPLETARAELYAAAIAFADTLKSEHDIDGYANSIIRLEVAAKAFSDSELRAKLERYDAVPKDSPFEDEGCAWTYGEWMMVRQKVINERDVLLKDKARLDWLETMQKQGIDFDICVRDGQFYISDIFDPDAITPAFQSFRQAIDEAAKRITPPGNHPDGAS